MSVEGKTGKDKLPVPYFAMIISVVILALASAGAWFYTGLVSRLGEWQFANFGLFFNLATILIFVALLVLVWRILRALLKRNRSEEEEAEDLRRDLIFTKLAQKILFWLGVALLVSAVVTTIYLLLLPSDDLKTREITAAQAASGPEGPVESRGMRAIGPTARYRQGFIFWERTYFFMPVASIRNGKIDEAAVFLEVPARLARSNAALSAKGILRHDALPDEVAVMYDGARFPVADSASVIFANETSSGWSSRVLLYNTILLGLLSWLFSWMFKRRKKRLEDKIADE